MSVLSPPAVEEFHQQGYHIRNEPLFRPADFDRLCHIFEEHLAARGEKRSDQLDTPHFHDKRLLEFLLDESVLDIVESLIGRDIGLWSSHFISKEPKTGRSTSWHSDAGYWNGRFEEFTGLVTIWLAIDRSDRENGCMRVIPGTHRTPDGAMYRSTSRPIRSIWNSRMLTSQRRSCLSWIPTNARSTIQGSCMALLRTRATDAAPVTR